MEGATRLQVFLNGDFIDVQEARISAFDVGFLLGHGAFETMRAYAGKLFRPAAHLRRLNEACTALDIPFQEQPDWLEQTVSRLLAYNGLSEARVRLTVSPGPQMAPPSSPPTVLLAVFPLQGIPTPVSGWSAGLYRGLISSGDPLRTHKTTSYLEKILARKEARANGFDEALFLNERLNITEGSVSNIFCVRNGRLITPPVSEGLLPGITREVVAELSATCQIPLLEQPLPIEELRQSEEAFLTNSVVEIIPLVAIDNTPIGKGIPGSITVTLGQAYSQLIRQELLL